MSTRLRTPRPQGRLLATFEWLIQIVWWCGLLALAFGLARVIDAGALGTHAWSDTTTGLLLLAGVVAGVLCFLMWAACHQPAREEPPPNIASYAPALPVAPTCDLIATFYLVIDPSRYSSRTVERVCFVDGYYRHDVSRDFEVPVLDSPWYDPRRHLPSPKALVLFPALRLARGVVIDNLELRSADGARINGLNAGEYLSITRELLRGALNALADEDLPWKVKRAIARLLEQGRFDHLPDKGRSAGRKRALALKRIQNWIDQLPLPGDYAHDPGAWAELRERVARLCHAAARDHIVFAPVVAAPGERVVIHYSYTAPHHPKVRLPARNMLLGALRRWGGRQPPPTAKLGLGLRDSIRYHIGLRPHRHRIPVTAHRWSQSYHLEFAAPTETYVYSCDVIHREREELPGTIVTFPAQGSRGGDYVHFYLREAARTEYRERPTMVAEIDCREKPPGLIGYIAVLAAAQAILIWVVGWHIGKFFGSSERGTDLPALLLALPGLVTGWLGAQFTAERLRSTSIATLVGLLGTGMFAILSTATALSKSEGDFLHPHLGVLHPVWTALMLGSFVLAVDLAVRGFLRTRRFVQRINLQSDDTVILV